MSRAFGLIVVTGIAKENAAMQNGALTISAVGNNKLRYEALRSVHAASCWSFLQAVRQRAFGLA